MGPSGERGLPVQSGGEAHVLVVAHRTAATEVLLDAVRARAERGPARFHLLVPSSPEPNWHLIHRERHQRFTKAEEVLALALPLIEDAADGEVDGSMSIRHDPMDAIEEALGMWHFDEIILSTLPRGVSRWLHIDLPRRVAHLGLPVTTVIAPPPAPAGVGWSGSPDAGYRPGGSTSSR
jgi:hypothetical protein